MEFSFACQPTCVPRFPVEGLQPDEPQIHASFAQAWPGAEFGQQLVDQLPWLLRCKTKNEVVAEYALRGMKSPTSVAEYQLLESLPKDLEASLPSVERIEEELGRLP